MPGATRQKLENRSLKSEVRRTEWESRLSGVARSLDCEARRAERRREREDRAAPVPPAAGRRDDSWWVGAETENSRREGTLEPGWRAAFAIAGGATRLVTLCGVVALPLPCLDVCVMIRFVHPVPRRFRRKTLRQLLPASPYHIIFLLAAAILSACFGRSWLFLPSKEALDAIGPLSNADIRHWVLLTQLFASPLLIAGVGTRYVCCLFRRERVAASRGGLVMPRLSLESRAH